MPQSSGRSGGPKPRRRNRRRGRRLKTVDETSAGGLVLDFERRAAAVIGRLDRRGRLLWSLPKGHIEAGETAEQTAVREVAEETGIHSRVLRPLGSIDYWFVAEDRRVHKTVHHFLLEALGGELSDEDVEVTEVAWVPLGELDERLAYADERRLVRRAAELISEHDKTRHDKTRHDRAQQDEAQDKTRYDGTGFQNTGYRATGYRTDGAESA